MLMRNGEGLPEQSQEGLPEESQTECPKECPEGCKMRNIAFLQYQYGTGSSATQKSAVSDNNASICINNKKSDFGIIKNVNKDRTEPGDVLTYKVYVTNTGDTPLTNVVLTDKLDSDATYVGGTGKVVLKSTGLPVSIAPINYNNTTKTLIITVNSPLPVGETFVFSYDVTVSNPITGDNNIRNNVSVDTNETLPKTDETVVPVSYARVTISKAIIKPVGVKCVRCGEDLTYQITVKNEGNTPATNLLITDLFDSEFCFDKEDVTVSIGATVDVAEGLLKVTIAQLNAGATATITVAGKVCCCKR